MTVFISLLSNVHHWRFYFSEKRLLHINIIGTIKYLELNIGFYLLGYVWDKALQIGTKDMVLVTPCKHNAFFNLTRLTRGEVVA